MEAERDRRRARLALADQQRASDGERRRHVGGQPRTLFSLLSTATATTSTATPCFVFSTSFYSCVPLYNGFRSGTFQID